MIYLKNLENILENIIETIEDCRDSVMINIDTYIEYEKVFNVLYTGAATFVHSIYIQRAKE